MNAAEVVRHEAQRDRRLKVLNFFAESIDEPGEPPHAHPHRHVIPLRDAG